MKINRRHFAGALSLLPFAGIGVKAFAGRTPKIIIVGGGFGGASAAVHLRKVAPFFDVTLIEANPDYHSCPFSNLVITGERDLSEQKFGYASLKRMGITVIHERATDIDPAKRIITIGSGNTLGYDKLILSPGIDFIWNAIDGYDEAAANTMPHAWKAGPQTALLRSQLEAMEDGGTVAMAIPPAPFRCPPGPYERASLIAHYLKVHKPRSKLILLDAQDRFSKQPLFEQAWQSLYPDLIERIPGSELGEVISVDPSSNTLITDFDAIKADVANVIPPQKAGIIADRAGVMNETGWCPINAETFESKLQKDIYVIGDATIASPMPKSAFSANLQGKICAIQIACALQEQTPISTTLVNTCFSFAGPDTAFSVSGVYSNSGGEFQSIPGAGGTSPTGSHPDLRKQEAAQAQAWFEAITQEAFG